MLLLIIICVCCGGLTATVHEAFQIVAHHVLPEISDSTGSKVAHLRSLRRRLEVYRTFSLVLPDVPQRKQGVIARQILVRDTQASERAIRVDFRRCFVDLLGHRHLLLAKHGDLSRHVLLGERECHGAAPRSVSVHRLHQLLLKLLNLGLLLTPVDVFNSVAACDCSCRDALLLGLGVVLHVWYFLDLFARRF